MHDLLEIISAALEVSDLDAVMQIDDPVAWDEVWDALPYQSVGYESSMIDYQHAYFRGAGWTLLDVSLVLRVDGRPCGIWPLTIGGPPGQILITSAGAAVMAPLFSPSLSTRTAKKICQRALALLRAIYSTLGSAGLVVAQGNELGLHGQGCSEWHQQLLAAGWTVIVRHDLYVDLLPELATIRASFRKSFKPLINAGLPNWDVFVLSQENASSTVWSEFKQLHCDVSKRSTRNDETWTKQFAMVRAGQAFLVGLRDKRDQRLIGAGFFQCTRDEGLYAVGAYDRDLFDKPLGHVVQQRAIETMKIRGLRWYCIGERHYHQDSPVPTDKIVSIAEFKQGFASHMFCRFQFSLPRTKNGEADRKEQF